MPPPSYIRWDSLKSAPNLDFDTVMQQLDQHVKSMPKLKSWTDEQRDIAKLDFQRMTEFFYDTYTDSKTGKLQPRADYKYHQFENMIFGIDGYQPEETVGPNASVPPSEPVSYHTPLVGLAPYIAVGLVVAVIFLARE